MKKRNQWGAAADEETAETPETEAAEKPEPDAAAPQDQGGMVGSNARAAGPPVVTPFALPAAGTVTVMSRYSYPKSPGDERWSVVDVVGPASYTVVTAGAPPTGGQVVPASAFGLQSIDAVFALAGTNGTNGVRVIANPYNFGDSMANVTLMWIVLATGAQATAASNMSAQTVRLIAIGR